MGHSSAAAHSLRTTGVCTLILNILIFIILILLKNSNSFKVLKLNKNFGSNNIF